MRRPIYLKNNPSEFHPEPIWNDEAFGFFEERRPKKNKKKKNKMSSDMRSAPDPKSVQFFFFCNLA